MKKLLFIFVFALFTLQAYSQYEVIHEFEGRGIPIGSRPEKSEFVTDGSKLYGMTNQGGANDGGIIFSTNLDGSNFIVLHEFAGGDNDGRWPFGSLTLSGSTLYGMTQQGGYFDSGTIFSIGTDGSDYTLLHKFTSGVSDVRDPWGSLTLTGSTLYGMTQQGGANNYGTIFSISTSGSDFTLLHEFTGGDGCYPLGSLTLSGSTLYGMTNQGGYSNKGTIFSIGTDASDFTLLHEFAGYPNDGSRPLGSLTLSGSTLYGMTRQGGDYDVGIIFSIGTLGGDITLLHKFAGGISDGSYPSGSLTLSGSTLYGMTYNGGDSDNGIMFSIGIGGLNYRLLHAFAGSDSDGGNPNGSLTLSGSTLYGMTRLGGDVNSGTIFSIGTDGLNYGLLYEFNYGANAGRRPNYSELVSDGFKLYSMTTAGGAYNSGLIFSTNLDGSDFTVLHEFIGGDSDGSGPWGSLTLSGSTLYGMTTQGGANDYGTIFSISTSGSDFTLLHEFAGTDGSNPYGSLTISGTTLLGMAYRGGDFNKGTIFSIGTDGSDFTLLHEFAGTDGSNPYGSLTLSGSTLYGMTQQGGANNYGTIFSIATSGGDITLLHEFVGGDNDGSDPWGSLTLSGSMLYGMTQQGGANNYGTIFSIATSGGAINLLHEFAGYPNDGSEPYGCLTLSSSTLYGMTPQGGANNYGTIFSISTDGINYELLHEFAGGTSDGYRSYGSLTKYGSTLYGMTSRGGDYYAGTIFRYNTAPTIQACNLQFSNISRTGMNVSWTRGNGEGCLLLCRQQFKIANTPLSYGVTYACNSSSYNDENNDIVADAKVLYNGSATNPSITVSGLTKYKLYYFRAFEYNNLVSPYYMQETATNNPRSRWTLRRDGMAEEDLSIDSEYPYPNPVSNSISTTLDAFEAGNITAYLFDNNGRQIAELYNNYHEFGTYNLKFDLTQIPQGAYQLVINKGSEAVVYPISVVR